jgi:hypothetical protein
LRIPTDLNLLALIYTVFIVFANLVIVIAVTMWVFISN